MANLSPSFLANRNAVYGNKNSSNNAPSSSGSANAQGLSSSFQQQRQQVYSQPPPKITPLSTTPSVTKPLQKTPLQQAQDFLGGVVKNTENVVKQFENKPKAITSISKNEAPKIIKELPSGVKISLTTPTTNAASAELNVKKKEQKKIAQQPKPQQATSQETYSLPDGTRLPKNSTISAAKPPTMWDHITEFFNNMTGNSALDQKARAMNAYAVTKVDGEKLYKKRVNDMAKEEKVDPKALDKAIQDQAKVQGKSKLDMVGLGMVKLAEQGGNPFKNSTMEDVSKEIGIRDMPTNKEFTDLLMTAALGFGLAEAPLATLKAVGLFTGVNEVKSGLINTIKGSGFKFGAGQTLSDLTPEASMPVKTALDFIDFLGTAGVVGGIYKASPKVGEKFTKDVLTKYGVPETVHFSPQQVEKVINGVEVGKMKEDLAKAGLSSSEWRDAATKGIQITLPTEKIVTIVDKPYWKKVKSLIGMEAAAPQVTVVKDGRQITNIAGYLPSGEYTPQEAIGKVVNTPLADTVEGKEIVKAAITAQEQGKNIVLDSPEVAPKIVTKETIAKEDAQKQVRIKPEYKSALEKQTTEALHSEPIKYRDQYIEKYVNIVNPDLARKLADEYNGLNAKDINNFGVGVKNIVLKHLLDTGMKRTDSNKTVYWTGGGPGSGKSTTLDAIPEEEKKKYVAIIDTTLSPNSTVKDIKKILNQGYKVAIDYTLADPFEAWKRVISRAMDEKSVDHNRIVSEEYFIKAHEDARNNAIEAYDKFHTNPAFDIAFYDNLGKKSDYHETTVDFVRKFKYNPDELRGQIHEYTEKLKTEGKLSEELYRGFTEDRKTEAAHSGVQKVEESSTSKTPELKTLYVESSRLSFNDGKEGDISRSYSADVISEGKLRRPFTENGKQYVSMGGSSEHITAWELIPVADYKGKTFKYGRQEDNTFTYEGMLGKRGKDEFALSNPLEIFDKKLQKSNEALVLRVSKADTLEASKKERIKVGFSPESVNVGNLKTIPRPRIGKTDIKTLLTNSAEFKANPVLVVNDKKDLVFDGEKIHFKIAAEAMGLNEEKLKSGEKIKIDVNALTGREQQMRVYTSSGVYASKSAAPLGSFEKINPAEKITDFKLAEKTKELVRKYASRIGEGYTPRQALGSYHLESQNIRTVGINNFSVNTHEIAHAIDDRFKISMQIAEVVGEYPNGNPKYDPKTLGLRQEMTRLYKTYYPGGRGTHAVRTRMVEGFATLVQKYIEMPSTITEQFPNLYREFLTSEGKYHNVMISDYVKDAQTIVSDYQGLGELDKIGARVVDGAMKTDKSFLNFFEKARTIFEDELYPVEKVGKIAGTQWSGDDPSLWLRQYSRGAGVYANNILNAKLGYWSLDESGNMVKKQDFNWKNLIDTLQKTKETDSFGYYLVARDQTFQWKELDRLKAEYDTKAPILELGEKFGIKMSDIKNNPEVAESMGVDVGEMEEIIKDAQEAKRAYEAQKKYLDNNGFLREEVEQAYEGNKDRFAILEKQYDVLVREDLNLLHNPLVGMVNDERYDNLTAKEGYASMKRTFFDDILGDAKEQYMGSGGKLAPKISSLKKRTGGQQQIINPVLNGMVNHIEIMKKSMKMVIYNKVADIALKGTAPELFQKVQLRSFKDDTGKIIFPQEKDENIIMARINYKRTPILVDKLVKNTIDNTLTYQSMNMFEHLLTLSGRVFTIGTTGAFAPFSLVNFPADQWNAILNTRNNYTPVIDQIKILGSVMTGRGGKLSQYWNEWSVMGGDRMSLFQSQMQSTDEAVSYITQEKNGLEKVIGLLDKGVDLASIPSKYSETASRFAEYVKARKEGKHQVVALEEAGRVTTPFHHIGSWKFGDQASAKFLIRSIPFGNASLQVVAQAARTAETPKGRRRLYFVLLAATAAYLTSMGMISQYGTDDQKEQYKDLRPNDIASYLHYPALSGNGLVRVRISQELTTIGTLIAMAMGQSLLGAKYTPEDYKDALTEWMPRQTNILNPVEMFFSWFNPIIKIPIETLANFKDYPRITPIENQSMQNLEPKDRYNEATSALAKQIGQSFNLSPLKVDYFIQGLFGRATNILTGKPGSLNPISQVDREYFLTTGKRVEQFYEKRAKYDQEYASLREKWKDAETVPPEVFTQVAELKQKRQAYDYVAQLLKYYREIPQNDTETLKKARTQILPYFEKLP
jgi:hypothetical protein